MLISSIYNSAPTLFIRRDAELALALGWRHEIVLKVLLLLFLKSEPSVFLELLFDLFVSELLDLTVVIQ